MENEEKTRVIKWINSVLKDRSFEKISIDFPEFDTRGGYLSEITFVKVTLEKKEIKETLDLFIKKSKIAYTPDDEVYFKDAYNNEINLYSKFLPHFQKILKDKKLEPFKYIPRCYGTIIEKDRYIIILENLKPKDYRIHDIKKPLDLNHSKLVVAAYASWHALSFALKDQEPKVFEEFGKSNKGMVDTKVFDYYITTLLKELDFVIGIYEKKKKTSIAEKLKNLKESYADMCKDILTNKDEEYLVIVHGDCWNNNFLFHYNEEEANPDEVVIIDWQLSFLCSPMADLVCYLFHGSSRKELEHLDTLLELYYDTLSNKLIELGSDPRKCFPKEIFLETFKQYVPFGLAEAPMIVKLSYLRDSDAIIDLERAEREENLDCMFEGDLSDPDEYFNRIDGVLNFCIERGFL